MAKQTFTTGQVLTAAQMTSLQQTAMGGGSATAKTTSYVLVAADAGTTVIMNAAGSTTITVNTSLFAAGDTVLIQNIGAGTCTVTAGTATVSTAGSLALTQYEAGILYFTATGTALFHDYVQAASNPLTTTGDMIYSSSGSTQARLGIGSTSQVLTVAGGIPSWATPATPSSGANFISRTTFSASAAVTVDSLFSTTYENYLVNIQAISTTGDSLQIQGRYGSTTHTGADYQYGFTGRASDSATTVGINNFNVSQWNFGGQGTTHPNITNLTFYRPSSSGQLQFTGGVINRSNSRLLSGGGFVESSQNWGGLYIFPVGGTITGQITVYGLAKS